MNAVTIRMYASEGAIKKVLMRALIVPISDSINSAIKTKRFILDMVIILLYTQYTMKLKGKTIVLTCGVRGERS